MGLAETVTEVIQRSTKLRDSKKGNEANTKALLIEPVLRGLGWDTEDLDAVQREVKVYEGTYLDYALLITGGTKLYVEAKGIAEKLDDKKFIAQTVNYANNDGVVWCVLTNGVQYRVYKTNEPVQMDQKLLFEVDLREDSQSMPDRLRQLRTLSRDAVTAGELDALGERVFTDTRIRAALSKLATDPPAEFEQMLHDRLGHPSVAPDNLRRSLLRVLDGDQEDRPRPVVEHKGKTKPVGPAKPPTGKEYPLEHHLGGKSSLIRELFEAVDDIPASLGGDVTRRTKKMYVGYYRGKRSFLTVQTQKSRLLLYLSLDPHSTKPWNEGVMRDVRGIGHYGMGHLEYSFTDPDQLADVRALIQAAYVRAGSKSPESSG